MKKELITALVFFMFIGTVVSAENGATAQETIETGTGAYNSPISGDEYGINIPETIEIILGERFKLLTGQTGVLYGQDSKIVYRLDNIVIDAECKPESEICVTGSPLAAWVTIEKSEGNAGTGTQVKLRKGESTTVFGYELTLAGIGSESAAFVVSGNNIPETIKAGLGKEFSLKESQTALIIEGNETVLKLLLEEVVDYTICPTYVCKEGQTCGCESTTYAVITASNPRISTGLKVKLGQAEKIDEFKISFVSNNSGKLVFKVEKESQPGQITVYLDRSFGLNIGQTAIVKETGASVFLKEIYNLKSYPVQKVAVLAISMPHEVTAESGDIEIVEANSGKTIQYPYVDIREGESVEKYGLKFSVLGVSSGSDSIKMIIQNAQNEPEPIKVGLGQKFELEAKQKARVFDNGLEVFNVRLNEIVYTKCYSDSGSSASTITNIVAEGKAEVSKCMGRPYVRVDISSPPECSKNLLGCTVSGRTVILYEGENASYGDYNLRLLDLSYNQAVFIVEKQSQPPSAIKVRIGEKFSLEKEQSAIIVDAEPEDLEVKLWSVSESGAKISVGPLIYATGTETIEPRIIYFIGAGEELSVHGITIALLGVGSNNATFTTKKHNGIINVHINEKFELEENEAARVLGANMRIDVISIITASACPICEEGMNCGSCQSNSHVEFSVSNYLYDVESTGIKTSEEASQNIGVSKVTADTGVESVTTVPMPPMPFRTYSLSAGEEVEVGDFVISVLDVTPQKALFIVEEKSIGKEFTFQFKKGWNLIGYPGEIEAVGSNNCGVSSFTMFEYTGNGYEKITKPAPGKAYWLYNKGESCSAKMILRKEVSLGMAGKLSEGWNFNPVVPAMGNNIESIIEKSSCSIKAVYRFDSGNNTWENMLTSNTGVGLQAYLGEGLAIYSENACTLEPRKKEIDFPQLPEVN